MRLPEDAPMCSRPGCPHRTLSGGECSRHRASPGQVERRAERRAELERLPIPYDHENVRARRTPEERDRVADVVRGLAELDDAEVARRAAGLLAARARRS